MGDGAEIKSNSLLTIILKELKNITKENLLKLLQNAKTKIETLIESVNSLSTPVIDKFSELHKAITEPQRQIEEVVKSE